MNELTNGQMIECINAFTEEVITNINDQNKIDELCADDIIITFKDNTTSIPINADTVDAVLALLHESIN